MSECDILYIIQQYYKNAHKLTYQERIIKLREIRKKIKKY